jgi:hypothetical protein
MLKRSAAIFICALMAACGSSDGPKGNAAANTIFTYGTTSTPVSGQSSTAISGQIQNMVSTAGSPSGATASQFQSFSGITNSLLGSTEYTGYSKFTPDSPSAARDLAFNLISKQMNAPSQAINPACYTATATSVTFNNCTDTETFEEMTVTYTINGSVSVTGSYTLAWNFTIGMVGTGTGSAAGVSVTAAFSTSGNITLTELTQTTGTIVGSEIASLDITVSAQGQSARVAVDESLDLNVQYNTSCNYFVVGGTLEAKRVWTAVPQGLENELRNVAVKVTWTGCGTGTYVRSVN